MLLKILDKLGRKKVVLDRGPSHPEFDKAKPWLSCVWIPRGPDQLALIKFEISLIFSGIREPKLSAKYIMSTFDDANNEDIWSISNRLFSDIWVMLHALL